jgi:hypothetical protein
MQAKMMYLICDFERQAGRSGGEGDGEDSPIHAFLRADGEEHLAAQVERRQDDEEQEVVEERHLAGTNEDCDSRDKHGSKMNHARMMMFT